MKQHVHDGCFYHYCPGCQHAHSVGIDGSAPQGQNWSLSQGPNGPTLSPSVRSFWPACEDNGHVERTLCHYFLADGVIQYLDDSSGHALRGHVPLPDFPDGYSLRGL